VYIALQLPGARTQQELRQLSEALEHCCTQGVLRHCNRLSLFPRVRSTSQAVTSAVLQTLGRWWRPDPSLVDGSSPFSRINAHTSHNCTPAGTVNGWNLALGELPLSREALAALPQGLTHLELW
jgi:hypothetical protein